MSFDINWVGQAVGWAAVVFGFIFTGVIGMFARNFRKLGELDNVTQQLVSRITDNEKKVDKHISDTAEGFVRTIDKIDSMKDQLIEVILRGRDAK